MIAALLLSLAVAAPGTGSGARIDVRVSATIVRGVTVRSSTTPVRLAEVMPTQQRPRRCDGAEVPLDCRLIVLDLP